MFKMKIILYELISFYSTIIKLNILAHISDVSVLNNIAQQTKLLLYNESILKTFITGVDYQTFPKHFGVINH